MHTAAVYLQGSVSGVVGSFTVSMARLFTRAGSTFVDSLEAAVQAANGDADGVPVGLVLDSTSFYAESGGQVRPVGG